MPSRRAKSPLPNEVLALSGRGCAAPDEPERASNFEGADDDLHVDQLLLELLDASAKIAVAGAFGRRRRRRALRRARTRLRRRAGLCILRLGEPRRRQRDDDERSSKRVLKS